MSTAVTSRRAEASFGKRAATRVLRLIWVLRVSAMLEVRRRLRTCAGRVNIVTGFRPNRSAHDAIRAGQKFVQSGKRYVVDIDLKSFFDEVDHDKLMHLVGYHVEEKSLKQLIGAILRAPVQRPDGSRYKRGKGTPQGGPLSPLLANLYLDPLDKELEKRGLSFVRYADDLTIFVSSPRSAERVLASITEWIEKHLKVPVNREKSGGGPSETSALLGYRIQADGTIVIAPKSLERMKTRVRELWDARQSLTSKQLCDQWSRYIRGWWNYFHLTERSWDVEDLSGWIRRHIRKCFWLRWKTPRGRINALRGQALRNAKPDPCRVQPPDADVAKRRWTAEGSPEGVSAANQNRMSGGVEGSRGAIPVSPSDLLDRTPHFSSCPALFPSGKGNWILSKKEGMHGRSLSGWTDRPEARACGA
jgi:RNA-directed DNA polymerase